MLKVAFLQLAFLRRFLQLMLFHVSILTLRESGKSFLPKAPKILQVVWIYMFYLVRFVFNRSIFVSGIILFVYPMFFNQPAKGQDFRKITERAYIEMRYLLEGMRGRISTILVYIIYSELIRNLCRWIVSGMHSTYLPCKTS